MAESPEEIRRAFEAWFDEWVGNNPLERTDNGFWFRDSDESNSAWNAATERAQSSLGALERENVALIDYIENVAAMPLGDDWLERLRVHLDRASGEAGKV